MSLEHEREQAEVLFATSRAIQASFESSFQPTIQLYLILHHLIRSAQAETFNLKIFTLLI